MAKYKVTIRATVTKTIEVDALGLEEANEQANEMFTTNCDAAKERYEQETVSIENIEVAA